MGTIIKGNFPEKTDQLRENFWDPNMMTYYWEADIPQINHIKKEIGKVLWADYISRLITISQSKNTILGKVWQETGNLPQNIRIHLDKMSQKEIQMSITLLNNIIKKVNTSMKKELMAVRNYMMK